MSEKKSEIEEKLLGFFNELITWGDQVKIGKEMIVYNNRKKGMTSSQITEILDGTKGLYFEYVCHLLKYFNVAIYLDGDKFTPMNKIEKIIQENEKYKKMEEIFKADVIPTSTSMPQKVSIKNGQKVRRRYSKKGDVSTSTKK